MLDGADQLPDDPVLLKQMIAERDAAIMQIKREASEQLEAERQQHKAIKGDEAIKGDGSLC